MSLFSGMLDEGFSASCEAVIRYRMVGDDSAEWNGVSMLAS